MRLRSVFAAALAAAVAAGAARADAIPDDVGTILEKADHWELMSLEPLTPAGVPAKGFHGWEVIGKTDVKDAVVRKKLMDALEAGVKGFKEDTNSARCFMPRHGLVASHGGKSVEMVICFSCGKVRCYLRGEGEVNLYVTSEPADTFRDVLKGAKVPLPKN